MASNSLVQRENRVDFSQLLSNLVSQFITLLFTCAVIFALYVGWRLRSEQIITAENGIGYALGIIGGVLMLLLLLYPLRKRIRSLSNIGSVKVLFKIHMLFGILGPLLILFHSSFRLGSLNSSVALICMLLVAGSGLVGRYLYKRINKGLYGVKIKLSEFELAVINIESQLSKLDSNMHERLSTYEEATIKPSSGLFSSIIGFFKGQIYTRLYFKKEDKILSAAIAKESAANGWSDKLSKNVHKEARKLLSRYFLTQRQASVFIVSERLFALWHVLHLPLFFMMIISGVIHVFAVHMY